MGKKKSSSTDNNNNNTDGNVTNKRLEEPNQAVLLIDDWKIDNDDILATCLFRPIVHDNTSSSSSIPKVLCPLLNVPLIDYSLEFLQEQCDIDELYVVCCTIQVEQYILKKYSANKEMMNTNKQQPPPVPEKNSFVAGATTGLPISTTTTSSALHTTATTTAAANSSSSSCNNSSSITNIITMKVNVIRDNFVSNAGDALRELDKRNVITADPFLLLYGDVITNCNHTIIQKMIKEHKQRRLNDSSNIMTCVFYKQPPINNHSNSNNNNKNHNHNTRSVHQQHSSSSSSSLLSSFGRKSYIHSNLIVGIDPTHDNRIFVYDNHITASSSSSNNNNNNTNVPCSFLQNITNQIQLRTDLIDTGIDICSPDVLARFSDEFDYRDIRREFVTNSTAEEEEGLQSKIYAYILNEEYNNNNNNNNTDHSYYYAARVHCFPTYACISHDLLQRMCYPIVPDRTHFQQQVYYNYNANKENNNNPHITARTQYTLQAHYMYHESCNATSTAGGTSSGNVNLKQQQLANTTATAPQVYKKSIIGRTSVVRGPGMMGSNCVVGEQCFIERCVIGRNCIVGNNVRISNCFIWDDVTIEDNVIAEYAIVAHGVLIKAGSTISRGCVIGQDCIIGRDIVLPEYTRITVHSRISGENDDDDDEGFGDDGDDEFSDDDGEDEDELSEEQGVEGDINTANGNPTTKNNVAVDIVSDFSIVGQDGKGRMWLPSLATDDDDDSDDGENNPAIKTSKEQRVVELIKVTSIGFDAAQYRQQQLMMLEKEDDGFSDVEENMENLDSKTTSSFMGNHNAANDFGDFGVENGESDDDDLFFPEGTTTTATAGTEGDNSIIGRQKGIDVIKELKSICLEYEPTASPIENLAIELNSFKFSQNASYSDCTTAAMLAIMEKMNIQPGMTDGKLVADFKAMLTIWAPVLQKMAIGLDEEKAIVYALDACATGTDRPAATAANVQYYETMNQVLMGGGGMSFRFLLQTLHDQEIVSEEAVLAWAADNENFDIASPRGKLLNSKPVQDFLQWLEQDTSDEDDDDYDEDDSMGEED